MHFLKLIVSNKIHQKETKWLPDIKLFEKNRCRDCGQTERMGSHYLRMYFMYT